MYYAISECFQILLLFSIIKQKLSEQIMKSYTMYIVHHSYSTYSCSYPYSLLDLASGSHGIHPAPWRLLLWQVEHSLTNIDNGEVSFLVLPGPSPEGIALSARLQVVCKDWASVDGVNLL